MSAERIANKNVAISKFGRLIWPFPGDPDLKMQVAKYHGISELISTDMLN